MSNQHLVVNQLLGVTPNHWPTNFFFLFFLVFICEPYVSLLCAWWKWYFFTHFGEFPIVFDHANVCASLRSLIKIHNKAFSNQIKIKCLPGKDDQVPSHCLCFMTWSMLNKFSGFPKPTITATLRTSFGLYISLLFSHGTFVLFDCKQTQWPAVKTKRLFIMAPTQFSSMNLFS